MNDADGLQEGALAEQAQDQNAKLQALIDAMGELLAASRALLARLQTVIEDHPSLPPDARP